MVKYSTEFKLKLVTAYLNDEGSYEKYPTNMGLNQPNSYVFG